MSAFVKKEKETKVDDRWAHVLCPEVVEHFEHRETTKPKNNYTHHAHL